MSMKHVLTAVIWLLCLYTPLLAQGERPLKVKMADSIKMHEPEWLLDSEYPATYSEHCECDMSLAVWAKGGTRVLAVAYAHKSKEGADATYRFLMEWYGFSGAKEADESYLGELSPIHFAVEHPSNGSKMYAYLLRRGRGVLMVAGDSPALMKRFGALIAAEFPAT